MDKHGKLWEYVSSQGKGSLGLTFDQAAEVNGALLDRSFPNCRKNLLPYGFEVEHIFMKEKLAPRPTAKLFLPASLREAPTKWPSMPSKNTFCFGASCVHVVEHPLEARTELPLWLGPNYQELADRSSIKPQAKPA